MTEEEVSKLTEADVLLTVIDLRWVKVKFSKRVQVAGKYTGEIVVVVNSSLYKGCEATYHRLPKDVKRLNFDDLVNANVFADWLEDNDEQKAADKLRAEFPIA